ncbi:MAG: methyltransferase [Dissulfurimicrobium sp.]|uniref:methyltransferase n=1 Tax=Dissulfurimicrobium sp. TaxID=2022436 RepID=UPI00404A6FB8
MKSKIERSFSRASLTYDAYADVQIDLAERLIARLAGKSFGRILEIGCGTGCYTLMLSSAFKGADIDAIDISSAMIEEAKKKFKDQRVIFHLADGENLPASISGPFDLITANSVFHWFDDLAGTLARYKGLLGPEGVILFSTFGPETLWELKGILEDAFDCEILIPATAFHDCSMLKDMISRLFRRVMVNEFLISREYRDMFSLLRSLKATGVTPYYEGDKPLRFTQSRLSFMDGLYRKRFGTIKASYQVFLCEAC